MVTGDFCNLFFISLPRPNGCKHSSCMLWFLRCARCKLQNVRVLNKGIDWESGGNIYWRHEVHRNESLKVMLHGNAEFEATDVTIEVIYMINIYCMIVCYFHSW